MKDLARSEAMGEWLFCLSRTAEADSGGGIRPDEEAASEGAEGVVANGKEE